MGDKIRIVSLGGLDEEGKNCLIIDINGDFFVFGIPENNLEHIVVVNVHELVAFIVFCNASGRVASCFVGFADVFKHRSVLFSSHRAPIPSNNGRICTPKNVHCWCIIVCWFILKPTLASIGICIAVHSAWVFQGQGFRQVNTGPTTARRNVPARGCVRLGQQVFLVV